MTNHTDKELLILAAKAAGYNVKAHEDGTLYSDYRCSGYWGVFNPLTDDGDALRLLHKLMLELYIDGKGVSVRTLCGIKTLEQSTEIAATRRAIVRAAAAIGGKL